MARRRLVVTSKKRSDALPAWASEYVVLTSGLEERGVLAEVGQRLRVARGGGYGGLDVFLFLLCYSASGLQIGLRPFSRLCSRFGPQLAAVGGRRRWPSSASVSRALGDLSEEQVQHFGAWLLHEAVGAGALEVHGSVACRDTRGELWHAFDYDPTVTTLRHRALPVGPDLPEPERRSALMASAGYPGRKRGEVQFSRATLQHAGSALWLGLSLGPGNGEHRKDNERAAQSVRAWCDRTGVHPGTAVLRSDGGAGGSVPAMTTCVEAGVHYLTRLSRYEILESALVTEHLSSASWTEVEDALSGPKRQATELGLLTLSAGRRVVRDNGEPYEPIETRVVIARSALEGDGDKRGAGIAKDGWWYELFATDLPVAPWPAAEVVSFYYGRSGQENRFHQEDRELGLDRIFSCHLPGQHLASLVGLFVWNLRIARGAELQGPLPDKLPQQPPRVPVSVPPSRLPNAAEAAQPSPHTATSTSIPPRNATTSAEGSACCPGAPAAPPPDEPQASDAPAAAPPTSVQDLSPATSVPTCISAPLEPSALGALGWSEQLERLPRWHWDPLHGLVCPNDAPLRLHGVSTATDGSLLVRWRARVSACRDCPERMGCTSSPSPEFRKELWFSFGPEAFTTVAGLATIAKPAPAVHSAAVVAGNSSGANTPWRPTPADDPAGVLAVLAVSWPVLLPSVLRHAFREACGEILVEVKLRNAGPPRRVLPRYYAAGVAERQQRRRSWTWRCQRNELPAAAEVDITLHGGRAVAKLLEPTEKAHAAA